MASIDKYLEDPEFANWVKSGLALNITNEVLRPFVVKEITKLHQSIVKTLPRGVSCTGCSVDTACPKGICDEIQREIENKHWYPNPSFTNTCTGRWSADPWEIAKCYMPPLQGYKRSAASDADFSACINVIINCKHFQAFGTSDPRGKETDLSKSRDFRNLVMHGSSQKVTENDMKENLDILINILNMIKTPETEADTKEAREKIEMTKQLKIKFEDAIEVTKNAIEANADNLDKDEDQVQRERLLVNFEAGCRKALCRLTEEHISIQEGNLSVAAFLSKIGIFAERKDLCSRHQNMLFPKTGTHAAIREWDLFVYCFILEELDLYEPIGNAVSIFVREVKKIRNRIVIDASGVTQDDLSELCDYLIDTDLNTDITEIFNKDFPDVDVICSFNILGSWWREEEDYGKKPISKKQLNIKKQIMEDVDKRLSENKDTIKREILEMLGYRGEHVTLQGDNAAVLDTACEVRVSGCDEETANATQEHITFPDNNDIERNEAIDHFRQQRNLLKVTPEKGSIILNVKCSSITNVLDFWDSCIDGRAVEALSKVRDYYRRYFKCDTLKFDVILTKKVVSRCVNEIVKGLPSHFERLIVEVTDEVRDILAVKDTEPTTESDKDSMIVDEESDILVKSDSPASNLPKSIDIRTGDEKTKEQKQIKDIKPMPEIGIVSMVVDDGSDTFVKSEKPFLIMHEETDIKTEGEKTKEEKQIKAMAPLDELLKDPEHANWAKSGSALNITNEVLRPFVVKEITKLHQSIVKKLPRGVSCTGCNVNTRCPNSICDIIKREIKNKHWYPNPSFTNTCTGRWSTEPWEIAKCYMPPLEGYGRSSAADADFSACISVIINCKHFQAFGTSDPNFTETVYFKSKEFRNSVMYASPQKVTENDLRENLDILINILNMIKTPETEDDTKEAIEKITKIKADQLTIKLRDVIELQRTATEANADIREKPSEQVHRERLLVNFEAGCRKALCRLTEEHISKQEESDKKLPVSAFLSKIRIFSEKKDLCLRHKDMLFPTSGTPTDISEWDLFVYCFILELEVYEPLENAASLFVQEVKKIRDELLLDATGVTEDDLSELCDYLIDTDLNTEITEIFNKDSPDVDVIRSNNNLVAWWRQEEEYGNKQVSMKQLNITKQDMKELEENRRFAEHVKNLNWVIEKLEQVEENVTFQGAGGAEKIGAECEIRPRGCGEKTGKALQEHITNSNDNDTEKTKSLGHFCQKLNLKDVKTKEGSIILNVTCSSITNVIDFWDSCIDGRAVEALSEVRDYYRRYFKCDTLEFDVILTKKGVSRCVDEIVKDLPSRFEVLIDNVTHKVQEILKAKETPSLSLHKESDIIAEETEKKMITEGKQIKATKLAYPQLDVEKANTDLRHFLLPLPRQPH